MCSLRSAVGNVQCMEVSKAPFGQIKCMMSVMGWSNVV